MICVAPIKVYSTHGHIMLTPCGHCVTCYRMARKAHAGRLIAEYRYGPYRTGQAITLTLNDYGLEVLEDCPELFKDEVLKFRTKLKVRAHRAGDEFKCDIMIERGEEFGRLHAHVMLFGVRYDVANDVRFDHKDWKHGFIHAMDVSQGNIHYHAGHQNKKLVKPLWRSNTPLGHHLMDRLVSNFVQQRITKRLQPSWLLPVEQKDGTTVLKRFPWTPYMLRSFKKKVEKAGWRYPQCDMSEMLENHRELAMNPEFWQDMKTAEFVALEKDRKFAELAKVRKAKRRAL